jgi:predicted nucleic acid-binding protein
MFPAPFAVVVDACVLFPLTVRDTLLGAAQAGFFQLHWSEEILEEMRRNLVKTETVTEEQAARLVTAMKKIFPDAMVTDYESLIAGMKNDEKDRHVAAAAVRARAQVIVTSNLRDFTDLPEGIEAQSPDEFLCSLFDLNPGGMTSVVREQAARFKRPPRTLGELLDGLGKTVPEFADLVRAAAAA